MSAPKLNLTVAKNDLGLFQATAILELPVSDGHLPEGRPR